MGFLQEEMKGKRVGDRHKPASVFYIDSIVISKGNRDFAFKAG